MYQSRQLSKARRFSSRQVQILRSAFEQLENRVFLSNTIYVDAGAVGANTGASWADAYTDLAPTLSTATSGTEIRVAGGAYRPGQSVSSSFQLKNGVTIAGGYAGSNGADPNARDLAAWPTILSGDMGIIGVDWDNTWHVVNASGTDATAVLDGLTIADGNARGYGFPGGYNGGGMYSSAGSPTLVDCTFRSNGAIDGGGAIYLASGSAPTLTRCTFTSNHATYGKGGAVWNTSTVAPRFSGCTFESNTAASGGAIYNGSISLTPPNTAQLDVSDCTFRSNGAGDGGAIYLVWGSTATITHCAFISNSAGGINAGGHGGGVCNTSASTPLLKGCTFTENSAKFGGGLFNGQTSSGFSHADLDVTGCWFTGNASLNTDATGSGGGAIRNTNDSFLRVSNSVFSLNTAEVEGGAISNYFAFLWLTSSTLAGNSARVQGGGLMNYFANPPGSVLANCILWGNSAPVGGEYLDTDSTFRFSSCDIGGGAIGTGNIDLDPQFIRNPSLGADHTWGTADDDHGDLRLQATSPVIDAGNNAYVAADVVTDIRGFARIIDYPGVHDPGSIVDMGAYERGIGIAITGTPGADTVTSSATGFTLNGVTTSTADVDSVTFDGAGGWDSVTIGAGPSVTFPTTQHLESLTISDGALAAVAAGSNSVLVARALSIAPAAKLDLADNDLILDYTGSSSLDAVQSLINSARAGGAWTGSGIASSSARFATPRNTTLGTMESSDYQALHGAGVTFDGEAIDDSAVLVKYTYYGDTNFDGTVTFDDYSRTDIGFLGGRAGWLNGDFDGNGRVDFDDYSLIDLAFNTQNGALRPTVIAPRAPQSGGLRQMFGRSLR